MTDPERVNLADLVILNAALDELGFKPILPTAAARVYRDDGELGPIVVATRHYLLERARAMGEVI